MARMPIFTLEVRQATDPWRKVWSGPGQDIAVGAARRLARETRAIPGLADVCYVYSRVRVRQGLTVVLDLTPATHRVAGLFPEAVA